MNSNKLKRLRRTRRRTGLRKRLMGTPDRPRLAVFRSSKHIYAQVIDDLDGKTLAAANTVQASADKGSNVDAASQVGKALAERATAAGVKQVRFDRGGFKYHGRVKALADAAREGGLEF